jgi:hypothetical protein
LQANSWDSSVNIRTRVQDGRLGFNSSRNNDGIFFFATTSRPALGTTQPPKEWLPGALSHWVKRRGREAMSPLPQYVFMPWCLVKHRSNFTFALYQCCDRRIMSITCPHSTRKKRLKKEPNFIQRTEYAVHFFQSLNDHPQSELLVIK